MSLSFPPKKKTDKDGFYLTLPNKSGSAALHLPDRCMDNMLEGTLQKPINPHRQKLLAASKRAAKVEPVSEAAKASKVKAKAKASGTRKAAPQVPKVSAAEIKQKAKVDYMKAKDGFMGTFLDLRYLTLGGDKP